MPFSSHASELHKPCHLSLLPDYYSFPPQFSITGVVANHDCFTDLELTICTVSRNQLTNLQQFANRDTDYTNLEVNTFDITTSCKNISASTNLETAGQFSPHKKELEISAHWRVTKSGRQFFMYNNVQNSVVIFCTDENVRELAEHFVWNI
ncbi:Protein SOSEKI [Trichinella pseudospiralis]